MVDGNQSIIKSTDVNQDSMNENIDVVYNKVFSKSTDTTPGNDKKHTNFYNKDSEKLPQTGDSDNTKTSILGLIFIAFSTVLSIFGFKRKKNNI
ncbi:hypothetical protein AKUH3B104X_PLPX00290 (plasmid) [Apilactobacillus kunkeei]|nr:hypothetical protein AKUH3B104X_PLPX00290 [Apilactobacillus kunkeei]